VYISNQRLIYGSSEAPSYKALTRVIDPPPVKVKVEQNLLRKEYQSKQDLSVYMKKLRLCKKDLRFELAVRL